MKAGARIKQHQAKLGRLGGDAASPSAKEGAAQKQGVTSAVVNTEDPGALASKKSYFDALPDELLGEVFSHLQSTRDRAHIRLTHRRFEAYLRVVQPAISKLEQAVKLATSVGRHAHSRDSDANKTPDDVARELSQLAALERIAARRPPSRWKPPYPLTLCLDERAFDSTPSEPMKWQTSAQKHMYDRALALMPPINSLIFSHEDSLTLSAKHLSEFLSKPAFSHLKSLGHHAWNFKRITFSDEVVFGWNQSSINSIEILRGEFRLSAEGLVALGAFIGRQKHLRAFFATFASPKEKSSIDKKMPVVSLDPMPAQLSDTIVTLRSDAHRPFAQTLLDLRRFPDLAERFQSNR